MPCRPAGANLSETPSLYKQVAPDGAVHAADGHPPFKSQRDGLCIARAVKLNPQSRRDGMV